MVGSRRKFTSMPSIAVPAWPDPRRQIGRNGRGRCDRRRAFDEAVMKPLSARASRTGGRGRRQQVPLCRVVHSAAPSTCRWNCAGPVEPLNLRVVSPANIPERRRSRPVPACPTSSRSLRAPTCRRRAAGSAAGRSTRCRRSCARRSRPRDSAPREYASGSASPSRRRTGRSERRG